MQNKKIFITFFLVILLKQLIWTATIPLWQTPDEQAHFAEVQNLAENNVPGHLSTSSEIVFSEKLLGVFRNSAGNNKFTYHPEYNIAYQKDTTIGMYENQINSQPLEGRKRLILNEATWYPPLYYAYSAIGYKSVYNSGLIDRVFFVRLWQVPIYILTIFYFYLSANLILKNKNESLCLSLIISLLPMFSFVFSGVTSDNLMNLLFSAVIYLCIRLIQEGISAKLVSQFIFIFILGYFTKPHFAIAVPIFFVALFFSAHKHKQIKQLIIALMTLSIGVIYALKSQLMNLFRTGRIGSFFPDVGSVSFLDGQRKLSIFSYFLTTLKKTYQETLPWFWGVYRWLSLGNPEWLRKTLSVTTMIGGVFLVIYFLQIVMIKNFIKKEKGKWLTILFLFLLIAIYFGILFFWDYLFFLSHNFSFGIQGRYYFPVLFSIIFLLYYPLRSVIKNVKPYYLLLLIFSMMTNIIAYINIVQSYYSLDNLLIFLNQFGQYKPTYFKGYSIIVFFCAFLILFTFF